MKKILIFIFTTLVFNLNTYVFSVPVKNDIDLAEKYKNYDIDVSKRSPDNSYGYFDEYKLPSGNIKRVYKNGYIIMKLKDSTQITIRPKGFRTVILPSGRKFYYSPDENEITWSPLKEQAPDFILENMDASKEKVKLSSLKGKVVLLDFWASWCGPCRKAMPTIEDLYRKYKNEGLFVYGINVEGDKEQVETTLEELGITYPNLLAESDENGEYNWQSKQIKDYKVHGIPAIFLIDKKGIIQYEDNAIPADTLIEKLLKE